MCEALATYTCGIKTNETQHPLRFYIPNLIPIKTPWISRSAAIPGKSIEGTWSSQVVHAAEFWRLGGREVFLFQQLQAAWVKISTSHADSWRKRGSSWILFDRRWGSNQLHHSGGNVFQQRTHLGILRVFLNSVMCPTFRTEGSNRLHFLNYLCVPPIVLMF